MYITHHVLYLLFCRYKEQLQNKFISSKVLVKVDMVKYGRESGGEKMSLSKYFSQQKSRAGSEKLNYIKQCCYVMKMYWVSGYYTGRINYIQEGYAKNEKNKFNFLTPYVIYFIQKDNIMPIPRENLINRNKIGYGTLYIGIV